MLPTIAFHAQITSATLCSFFKPEATPQQIEDKADEIAQAVQGGMAGNRTSSKLKSPASSGADVELSDVKIAAN